MTTGHKSVSAGLSRRTFVGGALATASAATVLPGCKFVASSGSNTIPAPPNFPEGIELFQQGFINWARENLQRALAEFFEYFKQLIAEYRSRGQYPYTGPFELRAHGLENTSDVLMPNAVEPWLSGARPHPDRPELDTVIWYAINNNVDQPLAAEFNTRLEQWFLSNYASYGIVRPEWTKCYAYTADGPFGGGWSNDEVLLETFPDTWRDGYPADTTWDAAVARLNAMDPHRVFTNRYLDRVFPA